MEYFMSPLKYHTSDGELPYPKKLSYLFLKFRDLLAWKLLTTSKSAYNVYQILLHINSCMKFMLNAG